MKAVALPPSHATSNGRGRAEGDLTHADSITAAARGVDAMFVFEPVSASPDAREHGIANAIEASKTAGIPHVVLSTSGGVPPTPSGAPILDAKRVMVENAKRLRPDLVILEPRFYLENLAGPWTR